MANPKSPEARQAFVDQNPFKGLKITDSSILNELQGRHPCPKCTKSRKFYCYSCYVPIAELEGLLPKIELPVKIDIIKHKHEIDGKSTAGHAAILAANDVCVYTYPNIPEYDENSTVLIFPSQSAITIAELITGISQPQQPNEDLPKGHHRGTLMKTTQSNIYHNFKFMNNINLPITKAIFIDSTWNQSKGIYKDSRIRKIPCVVIQNRISQFWRHQKGSPRWYLATIEAVHQFLLEIHLYMWGLNPQYEGVYNCFTEKSITDFHCLFRNSNEAYNGQYDDLLFFFKHMYHLIHEYYDHDNLYAYKRRLL